MRCATSAARLSLSPTLISSTATVSFSLIDRQHPVVEQGEQRVAGVEIARAIADVLAGEQHLPTWMPCFLNACSYSHISADCPTAAAACFSGIDWGRPLRPRRATPVAMAPEETSATSRLSWTSGGEVAGERERSARSRGLLPAW